MTVSFIRKPVNGELPFINADGHDIIEVFRTLRKFSAIMNCNGVADSVRLHPVQVKTLRDAKVDESSMKIIMDPEVLPSAGVLCKGDQVLAKIKNLSVYIPSPELDAAAVDREQKEKLAGDLIDEAAKFEGIAKSLKERAKALG
jgi:hypothetical protein